MRGLDGCLKGLESGVEADLAAMIQANSYEVIPSEKILCVTRLTEAICVSRARNTSASCWCRNFRETRPRQWQ